MHLLAVGGIDAGISAAVRAWEVDPSADVTVVVADAYPNFSICSISYRLSGDVTDWRGPRPTQHRRPQSRRLRSLTRTHRLADRPRRHALVVTNDAGRETVIAYDALVIGTGATAIRTPIDRRIGPAALNAGDGVSLLHTMGDTFAVTRTPQTAQAGQVVIVGAGYIGPEMAEAFTLRGLHVTQIEQLPEVLPTVDADLGALVRRELTRTPRRSTHEHQGHQN